MLGWGGLDQGAEPDDYLHNPDARDMKRKGKVSWGYNMRRKSERRGMRYLEDKEGMYGAVAELRDVSKGFGLMDEE